MNPSSVRPVWPLALRYTGSEETHLAEDALAFAYDIESLDTATDPDVAVIDADDRPTQAVIFEPGWCALAHVAQGARHCRTFATTEGPAITVEFVGEIATRAVVGAHHSTGPQPEALPVTWDSEHLIALIDESGTSVETDDFDAMWGSAMRKRTR